MRTGPISYQAAYELLRAQGYEPVPGSSRFQNAEGATGRIVEAPGRGDTWYVECESFESNSSDSFRRGFEEGGADRARGEVRQLCTTGTGVRPPVVKRHDRDFYHGYKASAEGAKSEPAAYLQYRAKHRGRVAAESTLRANAGFSATRQQASTAARKFSEREHAAFEKFVEYAMEHGGLTRPEAERALAAYLKEKVLKIDRVVGTFHVKHGAFLERDVLRRAAQMTPNSGASDFEAMLRKHAAIGDRVLRVRSGGLAGHSIVTINFYNLPQAVRLRDGGNGAEAENNRMLFFVSGFDRDSETSDPPTGKVKIEQKVSAPQFLNRLRAKTGTPAAIAKYLGEYLTQIVAEVPPRYTHTQTPNPAHLGLDGNFSFSIGTEGEHMKRNAALTAGTCELCGEPIEIVTASGHAYHVAPDGSEDFAADADHQPYEGALAANGGEFGTRRAGRITMDADALQEKLGEELLIGRLYDLDGVVYRVGGFSGGKVALWRESRAADHEANGTVAEEMDLVGVELTLGPRLIADALAAHDPARFASAKARSAHSPRAQSAYRTLERLCQAGVLDDLIAEARRK